MPASYSSYSLFESPRRFPWLWACLALVAGVLQAWSLAWPWHSDGFPASYGQPLWWLQLLSLAVLPAALMRVQRPWHGC
ncbi:hypothetical protein [Comamonas sp. JC664]|uniref:hypothetical protein n=1 Tax=Comamonas sp. JC664 TaxID=2801917 RepID=UPI00360ED9CC